MQLYVALLILTQERCPVHVVSTKNIFSRARMPSQLFWLAAKILMIFFFGSVNTTANYINQYSCAPMSFGRIVLNLEGAKQLDPKHAMAKKPGRPNKKMKKRMERQE